MIVRFRQHMSQCGDPSLLGLFRMLFGALQMWWVGSFLFNDRILRYYVDPVFVLTYPFLSWVPQMSVFIALTVFIMLFLSAIGICVGAFFRVSSLVFFICYLYVFFVDLSYYNNHYYLTLLIAFVLTFSNAHYWASVDAWRYRLGGVIRLWPLYVLRYIAVLMYFFAGLSKLTSYDWMVNAEPVSILLSRLSHHSLFGPLFSGRFMAFFISWGGAFFDLFIGFFLLWPLTRRYAIYALIAFHLFNEFILFSPLTGDQSIGIFLPLGIAFGLLFLESNWPKRMLLAVFRRS